VARHLPFRHAIAAGALTASLVACPWSAAVGAGTAPTEDLGAVETRLAALVVSERTAATALQGSELSLTEAESRLAETGEETAVAAAGLTSARERIGQLAAAAYRRGDIGPETVRLSQALSSAPDDLLDDAASLGARLAAQDALLRRGQRIDLDRRNIQEELRQQAEAMRAERDRLAAEHVRMQSEAASTESLLSALREAESLRLAAASRAPAETAARGGTRAAVAAPGPAVAGACAPSGSRGAEARLTPATLAVMRCGLTAFPQIEHAGGWGNRGNATDHDDGRAVDFMIPDYGSSSGNALGWAVANWARTQPGVDYVMFDSKTFGSWAPQKGWTSVADRGSDTANHRDHVHVSIAP